MVLYENLKVLMKSEKLKTLGLNIMNLQKTNSQITLKDIEF